MTSSGLEDGAYMFTTEVEEGVTRKLTVIEVAAMSQAISLKRIADALDSSEAGGKPQGSVLYWLEMIASAVNAGRS